MNCYECFARLIDVEHNDDCDPEHNMRIRNEHLRPLCDHCDTGGHKLLAAE